MPVSPDNALDQLNSHLNSPRRAWLFGAGISCDSCIPLMHPLTERVRALLQKVDGDAFSAIYDSLAANSHIEHVLSQLGDLIALAERSKQQSTSVGERTLTAIELRALHSVLLDKIGETIRYGYKPAQGAEKELIGTLELPIVTVDHHRKFIRAVFSVSQAGLDVQRQPMSFFTTNYDTLLEDALALERIPYVDGFVGGATGFWSPDKSYGNMNDASLTQATRVYKLHGSVDWYMVEKENDFFRCREGCKYPERVGKLLIYPQSTKYIAAQRDPFANVFARFRRTLEIGPDNVLIVCGYSFGDDHVNGEIEAVMARPKSKTVVVAFARESDAGFPPVLHKWLSDSQSLWKERLLVATDKGLYHGSLANLVPAKDSPHTWWTFQGLTDFLRNGPPLTEGASKA